MFHFEQEPKRDQEGFKRDKIGAENEIYQEPRNTSRF